MSRTAMILPLAWALSAAPTATASPVGVEWNLRFRHEQASDEIFVRDAHADTARVRLALIAAVGKGVFMLVEGEGIAKVGDDYHSGANGRTAWPGIADPKCAELNQAIVEVIGQPASVAKMPMG